MSFDLWYELSYLKSVYLEILLKHAMKRSLRSPPLKSGYPSNSGLQAPPFQPLNITYPPETVLKVKWLRDTFELDQP